MSRRGSGGGWRLQGLAAGSGRAAGGLTVPVSPRRHVRRSATTYTQEAVTLVVVRASDQPTLLAQRVCAQDLSEGAASLPPDSLALIVKVRPPAPHSLAPGRRRRA